MQQIEIFESVSNKDNTTITSNKQSISLLVNCGCKLTEHFFCGNTRNPTQKENKNLMNERSIYIELCKNHKQ